MKMLVAELFFLIFKITAFGVLTAHYNRPSTQRLTTAVGPVVRAYLSKFCFYCRVGITLIHLLTLTRCSLCDLIPQEKPKD